MEKVRQGQLSGHYIHCKYFQEQKPNTEIKVIYSQYGKSIIKDIMGYNSITQQIIVELLSSDFRDFLPGIIDYQVVMFGEDYFYKSRFNAVSNIGHIELIGALNDAIPE